MSEHMPSSAELEPKAEALKPVEKHHKSAEHAHHKAERKLESVEHLKHTAEEEAVSQEKVSVESSKTHHEPIRAGKELKELNYQRTLTRVRKKLNGPERLFSRISQQDTIDTLSQIGEKTIARPVSLFSGGLCAFIGTTLVFVMSKHYGFRYNFLLFALLFAGGFILGLIAELVIRLLRRVSFK